MNRMKKNADKNYLPVIGILGGMGPLATADIFHKLIRVINGQKDQDYNRIIIDSNSQIPDRIAALLEGGADPTPALINSISMLQDCQVDFIAVPCHTVFPFLQKVSNTVDVPILDMVTTVIDHIKAQKLDAVGILASRGAHKLKIYQNELEKYDIKTIELDESDNTRLVDKVRLLVKRGETGDATTELLLNAVNKLFDKSASTVALCCSDLPLAIKKTHQRVIDSNQLFAEKIVEYANNF